MTTREKTMAVLRIVVSKGVACYGRRNGKGGAWECNYCKACNPSLSSLEHVAGCHIGQAAALLAEMERGEVEWTQEPVEEPAEYWISYKSGGVHTVSRAVLSVGVTPNPKPELDEWRSVKPVAPPTPPPPPSSNANAGKEAE
jgi:hypothetical protein